MHEQLLQLLGSVIESTEEAKKIAELIARGRGGREVALAITKLQEARHWIHEAISETA